MEAYCMKCKEKREAKEVESVTMKNGKPAQQGICPVCASLANSLVVPVEMAFNCLGGIRCHLSAAK